MDAKMTRQYFEDSDRGMIRVRNTTFNHNDEAVQIFIPKIIVPRRPAVGSM